MKCDGCGNDNATFLRRKIGKDIDLECCDRCGQVGSVNAPDVYFKGPYRDEHLIDVKDPREHQGVVIHSRREKHERMRRLGVHELGDRYHGTRSTL